MIKTQGREAPRRPSSSSALALADRTPTSEALIRRFRRVRTATEQLAEPLSPEDQQLQSMPGASPTKWHRAHTTWFFETFLLLPSGYASFKPGYEFLFNSYYEALGPRHPRPARGLLSRPRCEEIGAYRRAIDGRVIELLGSLDERELSRISPLIELGLAHEEQHQELVLTDILHAFSQNAIVPSYRSPARPRPPAPAPRDLRFVAFDSSRSGLVEIGARDGGFAFDNELPRHCTYVEPFELSTRLVTVGEWKAFALAGGYQNASLWLSDGFEWVKREDISGPLHARLDGGALVVFTLDGEREAADTDPISHVSFYEADAIARFLGGRLPTEAEWELAASSGDARGEFLEDGALSPLPSNPTAADEMTQLFGDAWEWTSSSYEAYPGFKASAGAVGEYNGKFMCNQKVLRGGSCFTPRGHVRPSYRNFWYPDTRFQMTGIRVARDVSSPSSVSERARARGLS